MSDDACRHAENGRAFETAEHYATLREQCPMHHEADHDPPFWVLSRFDDVAAALKAPERWSNARGPGVFHQESGVLGSADDPDHARHRRILRPSFLPSEIRSLEPRIRAIADELIDGFVADGRGEFVEAFAAPLPALAIAELLGVAGEDRDEFGRWSNLAVDALTGGDVEGYELAKKTLGDYVERGIEDRLAAGPTDADALGRLAIAEAEGLLERHESRHLGYQLLVAGHETTTSLLGLMLFRLLERPELLARIRADHELLPQTIEEALRFDAPVAGLFRTNLETTTIHGATLPPDTKVQLLNAAANRDPAIFERPDVFDIDRDHKDLSRHLAFGWGIHLCIGAPLARLEMRVAFEQLLTRLGDIELDGEPVRNDSFVLHGLTRLPIRWSGRR